MSTFYEVWDYETRNQINCFETEAAARAFLDRQLELNGPDGVRDLAIVRQDPDGSGEHEPTLILEGSEFLVNTQTSTARDSGR
jgi:hypothetical protein